MLRSERHRFTRRRAALPAHRAVGVQMIVNSSLRYAFDLFPGIDGDPQKDRLHVVEIGFVSPHGIERRASGTNPAGAEAAYGHVFSDKPVERHLRVRALDEVDERLSGDGLPIRIGRHGYIASRPRSPETLLRHDQGRVGGPLSLITDPLSASADQTPGVTITCKV
jgi:hypothetical protein